VLCPPEVDELVELEVLVDELTLPEVELLVEVEVDEETLPDVDELDETLPDDEVDE
jgi:hypothetical protein